MSSNYLSFVLFFPSDGLAFLLLLRTRIRICTYIKPSAFFFGVLVAKWRLVYLPRRHNEWILN